MIHGALLFAVAIAGPGDTNATKPPAVPMASATQLGLRPSSPIPEMNGAELNRRLHHASSRTGGVAVGAVLGGILGYMAYQISDDNERRGNQGNPLYILGGAGVGAVIAMMLLPAHRTQ